ncbi:MAG: protein translocase subunit SecD [Thermodesulfobacteriota bacterium]
MNRSFTWRALVIGATVVLALLCLYPTVFKQKTPAWWPDWLARDGLYLGLDLQGGIHVDLEVQTDKAVESSMDRRAEEIKFRLRDKQIPAHLVSRQGLNKIEVQLARAEDLDKFNQILDNEFGYLVTEEKKEEEGRLTIRLVLDEKEADRIRELAVHQGVETIRNRLDPEGVKEPDIRLQGQNRIVIQLPGEDDPEKVKRLIRQTAFLEFKLVDESQSAEAVLAQPTMPPGVEVAYEVRKNPETGRETKIPYVLRKTALMTGETVTDARVTLDSDFNRPYVKLNFDAEGARQFERITEANVNRRLAIVLDGVVKSAPVIQERIPGGQARITGDFSMEEAKELAVVLRSGALQAPVEIREERTVGPSLGKDSIRQGLNSVLVGMLLVLGFMAVYYRFSGGIADVALFLNVIIIMAVMAAFKATLTLPGIAGIILTIGMSVDANVLIFERIREEIRLGKTPRAAVDGGFGKALLTILDANVTTLIAAVVLYQFGTGPIRGFAVTLSVGIVASMFTAIFVSRFIFDYLLIKAKMKAVSV